MSEEIAMPAMERPGVKDILLGRGHNVFNHIGNRRFRKLVDLHIQEYVESPHRKEKTAMVRDVIDLLTRAGYRFLKSNKDGIFEELDFAQILRKVGHALRDRSPLLDQHLQKNLKTRDELKRDQIDIIDYAEANASGDEQDEWRHERYYTLHSEFRGRQLWVRPKNYVKGAGSKEENDAEIASCLLGLTAKSTPKVSSMGGSSSITMPSKPLIKNPYLKRKRRPSLDGGESENTMDTKRQRSKKYRRHIKSVNDVVIPAMKNGELPYGGHWKFFPLPELHNKVNLGTDPTGWQLKLEPISFEGDPIVLDVPY